MAEKAQNFTDAWRSAHNLLSKYRGDFDAVILSLKMASEAETFLAENAKAVRAQRELLDRNSVEIANQRATLNAIKQEQRSARDDQNAVIAAKQEQLKVLEKDQSARERTLHNFQERTKTDILELSNTKQLLTDQVATLKQEHATLQAKLDDTMRRLQRAQATLAG